jgi:hypothetical protein
MLAQFRPWAAASSAIASGFCFTDMIDTEQVSRPWRPRTRSRATRDRRRPGVGHAIDHNISKLQTIVMRSLRSVTCPHAAATGAELRTLTAEWGARRSSWANWSRHATDATAAPKRQAGAKRVPQAASLALPRRCARSRGGRADRTWPTLVAMANSLRFGVRFDLDDLMRASLPRMHRRSMIEHY